MNKGFYTKTNTRTYAEPTSASYALTSSYVNPLNQTVLINLNNADYVNAGGSGSHIVLTNPNATGQNVITSINFEGGVAGKWRSDYQGNINNVVYGGGGHYWYTGGDFPAGTSKMVIFANGNVKIADQTTPTDAGYKLDVSGSVRFTNGLTVSGSLNTTGSVLFRGLTTTNQSNVITIDTATGQLYYTSSTAFGGGGITTPGGGDQAIQFNSASVFSGSAKLKYDYVNSNIILTGSILMSGSSYISGVDYIDFDTTASNAGAVGRLKWNDTDGTLDIGLKGGNVTLQVGQEQVIRVVNKTGANLLESEYKVVRVRRVDEGGAQGQRLAVVLAQGNNDAGSVDTLGLVTENIDVNQEGFTTTSGFVRGIDTRGTLQGETWNEGDVLYLSPTTAGQVTNIKPQGPNHTVILGYVVYKHQNNGIIFVKVDNGYELDELHNVRINTGSLSYGDLLMYSSSVWINTKTLSGSFIVTGSATVTGSVTTTGNINGATPTEIGRLSGVTSDIQTQLNSKVYSIFFFSNAWGMAAGTTYYIGNFPRNPTTTANTSRVYIPKAGTITDALFSIYSQGVIGSNNTITVSIRLNNTTDYLIEANSTAVVNRLFTNNSLSIPVVVGDYIEIKAALATPYTTVPTNNFPTANILIRTT